MNILVVDDSPTARQIIRNELEGGGYHVEEASSGEEVLERVKQSSSHLITMDVEMPGMNGFEVCAELRRLNIRGHGKVGEGPLLPIVFITGDDTVEGRMRGFNAGATDFLQKPFGKGAILKTVDGILKPDAIYSGLSVLIVDDSRLVRMVVAECLRVLGIRVVQASNGQEALNIIKDSPAQIDMVITDYHMPVLDGLGLCREIRISLGMANLPVLVLSRDAETGSALEMFKAGANDFLIKPFTKEVLLARVNAHLRTLRLNRELDRQVGELRRLNQLKNDFIAITSQDLRSPVASILSFVDLLLTQECSPEETVEFLGRIRESGAGLFRLINELVILSRLQTSGQTLKLEPLPIFEEVKLCLEPFQEVMQAKKIAMTMVNHFAGSPVILANQDGILTIMKHLITNALQFTSQGGAIAVEVQPEGNDAVAVWVRDTGIGMTQAQLAGVFDWVGPSCDSFESRHAGGRGLGLLIVKDLVDKQDATIHLFSEPGQGTRVRIVFPLASEHLSA